jgi:peroxiredoxin family protein
MFGLGRTAGAGVAPLGEDLLKFLACSLTLDLASIIEDEDIVDFERVKHAVVADF